jgi:hypothetical protein
VPPSWQKVNIVMLFESRFGVAWGIWLTILALATLNYVEYE